MSKEHVASRPSWSMVVLIVIAAVATAAIIVRTSPTATGSTADEVAAADKTTTPGRVKLAIGEQATLYKNDSFKVIAKCVDAGGGTITAEYGVKALVDNTLVFSTETGNTTDTRLDKADGLLHWSTYEPSSMTQLYYGYDYYQEFTGESPKGALLIGRVTAGVHMRGADCIYNGLFVS
ncbi:MAG TPA: hypothetical protein VI341_01155 [Actinomycetota bacterium]